MTELQRRAADLIIEAFHHQDENIHAADELYADLENLFNENPVKNRAKFLSEIPLVEIFESNPDVDQAGSTILVREENWQDEAKRVVKDSWNNGDYGDDVNSEIDALEAELDEADVSEGASFDGPMGFTICINVTDALTLINESEFSWPEEEPEEPKTPQRQRL